MKKYISIILLTLTLAGSSCKNDFLSLENNPNVPSVASPELLLSGSLKTAAALPNSTAYTLYAGWIGYLSWSTGFQANTALEQYLITTGTFDLWTNYYINISNFKALQKANAGPNYDAIAEIMTVFDYEALVDNYDAVPYTQAVQGTDVLTPAYDSGTSIYDDLMKHLDHAISTIKTTTDVVAGGPLAGSTAVIPGAGDIVFAGKMINWAKFANTLKLRLALRQSNLSAKTTALKAAIATTAAIGYLDGTVGAVANPGYLSSDASSGQQSPLWLAYGTTAAGGASGNNANYQANAQAAHYYGVNNDPRLIQVYSASTTANAGSATSVLNASVDVYNGVAVVSSPFGSDTPPNGIVPPATTRANMSPSKYGPGVLKSPTMGANILSSAEALFLQAEAAARGYITGVPATLYNAGIAASFADDLVPSAASAAATYAAQPAILYPAAGTLDAQVKAIIFQKWAALNLYGAAEAFHEYQRTGYPDNIALSIYSGANAPNQVTRIPYPTVEYSTNAANVAAQPTVNIFTSKIFWAK